MPSDSPGASSVVSVVVPCFDAALYLDECVQSLVDQTYRQIEIIAIDDGSTDPTTAMLAEWAARDDRLTVVRQSNRGLGAARNVGVSRATGEFLTFVDADDALPSDAIERMVGMIERTGSEFVSGVAERFDHARSWKSPLYRDDFRHDHERTHLFDRPGLLSDHIICSKLFRRSFWDEHDLRFPEGTLFEDIELATRAHCLANAVDLISTPTYFWRVRTEGTPSITQDRTHPGSVSARFAALSSADQYLREHAPTHVWEEHGKKVLNSDIRLYLELVPSADDQYLAEFVSAAGSFLRAIAPSALDEQRPIQRRVSQMLMVGDVRAVRAMAPILAPRAPHTPRSRLRGVRLLGWRDRAWLARVGVTRVLGRVRSRLGRSLHRVTGYGPPS